MRRHLSRDQKEMRRANYNIFKRLLWKISIVIQNRAGFRVWVLLTFLFCTFLLIIKELDIISSPIISYGVLWFPIILIMHFSEDISPVHQILIESFLPIFIFFNSCCSVVLVNIKIWQDTLHHCYEMYLNSCNFKKCWF